MNVPIIKHLLFDEKSVGPDWVSEMRKAIRQALMPKTIRELEGLIHTRYLADFRTNDGYSRLAYFLLSNDKYPDEALRLFDMDAEAGRQSWYHQLRYAECMAVTGDMERAFQKVAAVYAVEPEAVNGYAAIAWHLRNSSDRPSSPFALARRDLDTDRLSAGYMLNVAVLAMAEGLQEEACRIVEKAYHINSKLTDGYARCAWDYFWPRWPCGDYSLLFQWMEKDLSNGKLTPRWMLNLSQAYAAKGDYAEAMNLLAKI